MNHPADDRQLERRAIFELWIANVALGLLQANAYLAHVPEGIGAKAWFFLCMALFAAVAWTSGLVAGLAAVASRLGMRGRAASAVSAALLTAYQLALYIDGRTYDLLRYHFNGWVWAVLTTEGVTDSIDLDRTFWVAAGAMILATFAAMYGFQRWRIARQRARGPRRTRLRLAWIALLIVFVPLGAEKAMYALANLRGEREITAIAQVVPLYARLTVRRAAYGWRGMRADAHTTAANSGQLLLNYPLERPRVRSDGPRPNILIVAVESLRADMLASDVMPFTFEFSHGGRRFLNHASGGNASRYGTFALVYGLHGSYFAPVYAERASPVLVDALTDLGYEMRIYGTAAMTFPEMRSTAWVHVARFVQDALEEAPGESRDAELVRRFTRWARTRPQDRPFFAFAFLDAPHFSYHVVPERAPFTPYAPSLNRAVLSSQAASTVGPMIFNRYRNAVYDVDHSLKQMMAALSESGQLDNTLVVITGDHGEEFFEHGFWGHTANFTATEVLVPMVLRGPGVPVGVEARPTSHVDVAPTILELLGADPAQRSRWTVGENLLVPVEHRVRVTASWEIVGLWTSHAIITLPLDAYHGIPEVYDYDWNPVADPDGEMAKAAPALRELSESSRRFLR
jgi:membrane-anchored protein YejM (alkaline phosphatase superfamily)